VAQFVAAVPESLVIIEWMNKEGDPVTMIDGGRITESPIQRRDDRTYTRNVSVNPLRVEDNGTYTCEAAVVGEFITSQAASETFDFVVFGKYHYYDLFARILNPLHSYRRSRISC
jgi:hypothetical protein